MIGAEFHRSPGLNVYIANTGRFAMMPLVNGPAALSRSLHDTADQESELRMLTAETVLAPHTKPLAAQRSLILTIATVSLSLLVPCIWLAHIESTDLASHLYNAWLARLIAAGHLPGLWMNHQLTNVVFDHLLTWLLGALGPLAAERIAAYIAVLVFFWGAFSFICEASGRHPWFLLPCLAILAYGRVFYLGFFNFYLSVGFSFAALALLWKPNPWRWALGIVAILVACCCHPLGAAWAIATALYVCLAHNSRRKVQATLFAVSVLALAAIGLIQKLRFPNPPPSFGERIRHLIAALGWDQAIPFTRAFSVISYRSLELGILAILGWLLAARFVKQSRLSIGLPIQLYALSCCALLFLPYKFHLTILFPTELAFIEDRLSLIAAVLACAVVADTYPVKWQRAMLVILAAMYFALIYQDQRALNQIEGNITRLVSQLPSRQRVVAFLPYTGVVGQDDVNSMVDRACVGRCYSYGDYEPSSRQFRIRAARDNAFVLSSARDVGKLGAGTYVVQPRDLPLYQIYWCAPATKNLCIRPLTAGEVNGQSPGVPLPRTQR